MAFETLFAQPAREVADAKDPNERDNPLREFGKCAEALRNVCIRPGHKVTWNSSSLKTISTSQRWLFSVDEQASATIALRSPVRAKQQALA